MGRSDPHGPGVDGVLLADKPAGCTSHDVVEAIRRRLPGVRVGHAGTLDPFATGLLPLSLGRATRLTSWLIACDKVYQGWVRLGVATDTYDRTGRPLQEPVAVRVERDRLEEVLRSLSGERLQTPPPYSAKKVGGVAAHELARRREKFTLKPVPVEVYRYDITEVEDSTARFEIECAAGTYIRSLAHELGLKIGCGAHLVEICRTASGEFTLPQALTLEELEKVVAEERLPQVLVPSGELLPDLPLAVVPEGLERRLRHGGRIELSDAQIQAPRLDAPIDSEEWKPLRLRVLNQRRDLVAIAQAIVPRVFQPIVVLPAK